MVADSSPTASELKSMNVATLKEMCKEHGLKVSGKKQELIDRLLEATASDDDIFLLKYDRVMTITESRDQKIISIYNKYIQESQDSTMRFQTNNHEGEVKIDSNMGYLSSVGNARKKLEDIFKMNIKES